MRRSLLLLGFLGAFACAPGQFTDWQKEEFQVTPITGAVTKVVSLKNPSETEVQTVGGVGFDGSSDGRQHFRIDKIMVGNRIVTSKDIVIPPGSSLNIQITYQPRNLETTKASFGGWVTGFERRFVPYDPGNPPQVEEKTNEAIHRVVLLAVYAFPNQGLSQIELVGRSQPGPEGELSLPEAGVVDCTPGKGTACFTGNFSVDVPSLFTTGAQEQPLIGPIRFQITGSHATWRMEDLPPIILVLKGNGPGEPLAGQPVSSVSIIVTGLSGEEGEGTFDHSHLEMQNLSFRVRIAIGEITSEQIATLAPLVDFNIEGLRMTTEKPLTDGQMTLKIDTTLSEHPAGNPIFDDLLGNTQIIVRFIGELAN